MRMKQKRLFSFLLALALIIGLVVVPGTDASAAAKVKKLTLTKNPTVFVGASKQLTLKADGKKVTKKAKWSTSNKAVLTVKNGKITGKKAGVATVSAKFGGKTAKAKVTVSGLSSTKLTLKVGQTQKISFKKGTKAVSKGVTWASSNTSVVAVSNGVLTAKASGSAVITAKYQKKAFKCKVTVKTAGGNDPDKKPDTTEETKEVIKLSQETASLNPGDMIELTLTKGGEKIYQDIKWNVANTSSTPKGPWGNINVVSLREGSGLNYRGIAYVTGQYGGTATVTAEYQGVKYSCNITVAKGFDVTTDLKISYSTTNIFIDFNLKKGSDGKYDPEEIRQLRADGCTVDEESGRVTKDQICETAKYQFTKLPTTTEEIKTLFLKAEPENHGGFNAMAATVCAANTFKFKSIPQNPARNAGPYYDPIRDMFEFINGPFEDDNISNNELDNIPTIMNNALQGKGDNLYKCYFKGATSKNNYTPTSLELNMYRGPYYISEKETINGIRPTTYMIFIPGYETNSAELKPVSCEGYATDKYIDVWESHENNESRWYSFQNNYKHIIANDMKTPQKSR